MIGVAKGDTRSVDYSLHIPMYTSVPVYLHVFLHVHIYIYVYVPKPLAADKLSLC